VRGFTLANGAIVGITIDPGADYGAPQLEITDATGSGAVRDVQTDMPVFSAVAFRKPRHRIRVLNVFRRLCG
jgi:hypothetical protein